jgi:hypothetical protein
MKPVFVFFCLCAPLLMAGCQSPAGGGGSGVVRVVVDPEIDTGLRPVPRPVDGAISAPRPVQGAHTVEDFDTTTRAQREQAAATPVADGERKLGKTIGSLGDPVKPGFWLETPLVVTRQAGRVEYPGTGKSVAVDLIPIDGPVTAGSRVSLAALRLLGAPLTGLPELIVFAGK